MDVRPLYQGFAPIATCHWQGIANIAASYGMADAQRKLGLSWGFGWHEGGVLFGGGRWSKLLTALFGLRVDQFAPAVWAETDQLELDLAGRGLVFVAEIDAFYLPSPYQGREHVVHTVIVLDRTPAHAVLLDATNQPRPVTVTAPDYQRMRTSPCAGRLDTTKLYQPWPAHYREPAAAVIAETVQADVTGVAAEGLARLAAFIDWMEAADEPVNVCRVAAERHQAALLFDLLAEREVPWAARTADSLRELSDSWYLVHTLSAHHSAGEGRQRRRIIRLVRRLHEAEAALCGALARL